MAFSVTPTSGEPPFTLSADLTETDYIDNVHFTASVMTSTAVGSCPSVGSDLALAQVQVNSLINTGSTSSSSVVVAGSCKTFTLFITRVSDGEVVASSSASVNNIE